MFFDMLHGHRRTHELKTQYRSLKTCSMSKKLITEVILTHTYFECIKNVFMSKYLSKSLPLNNDINQFTSCQECAATY